MLVHRLISLVYIFAVICSCSTKPYELHHGSVEIKIDPNQAKDLRLSDIVDSISYLVLKPEDKDILGDGHIIFDQQYILYFEFQTGRLLLFDFSGRHINTIGQKGKGPGEWQTLSIITPSLEEGIIELVDPIQKRKILYTYPSSKYIRQWDLHGGNLHYNWGYKLGDGKYLLSINGQRNSLDGKPSNAEYVFLDSAGENRIYFNRVYPVEDSDDRITFGIYYHQLFRNEAEEMFASVTYNDTLYQFQGDSFIPVYHVVYPENYRFDYVKLMSNSKKWQFNYLYHETKFHFKASYPHLSVNNKDILLINYLFNSNQVFDYRDSFHSFLMFKNSDKSFHFNRIDNDITGIPETFAPANFSTMGTTWTYPAMWNGELIHMFIPSQQKPVENVQGKLGVQGDFSPEYPVIMRMFLKKELLGM